MPSISGDHGTSKANHNKLISLILKSLVMTVVTSLFFLFLGLAALLLVFLAAASLQPTRRISPRASIRRLPQFRFSPSDESESVDCAVCLDSLRAGQWCRALGACGHAFHSRCVDTWLVRVPACPICRSRVRLDSGGESEDFEEVESKWWWSSRVW